MHLVTSETGRRDAILKAARTCFLDRGFLRTTISDILALSGGSRTTIYEAFGSKEGLFAALVSSIFEQMRLPHVPDGAPDVVLRQFGLNYLSQLMDPEALALYRVALGESAHVRELGPRLFQIGPRAAAVSLGERLQAWVRNGALVLDDPESAAALFLAMVEGDLHRSAVMWHSIPSASDIEAHVEAAVGLFLRGAQPPPA